MEAVIQSKIRELFVAGLTPRRLQLAAQEQIIEKHDVTMAVLIRKADNKDLSWAMTSTDSESQEDIKNQIALLNKTLQTMTLNQVKANQALQANQVFQANQNIPSGENLLSD